MRILERLADLYAIAVRRTNTEEALRETGEHSVLFICFSLKKNIKGDLTGIVCIVDDIADQKLAEQKITEARKKAEDALRIASPGAMAAGIAPEINQPLNSLKVINDTIIFWHEQGKELEMPMVIKNLHQINDQVNRITDIVNHMRAIIKRNNKGLERNRNFNDAVKEALDIVQS